MVELARRSTDPPAEATVGRCRGVCGACRTDAGSGTVLVLALAGVVVLAMIAVLLLGGAAVAKARAQTSADLAALAGAQAVLDGLGTAEACDQAASVVEAHRATMAACSISSDARCEVRVSVPSPLTLTGWASLTAKARAVAGRPP